MSVIEMGASYAAQLNRYRDVRGNNAGYECEMAFLYRNAV